MRRVALITYAGCPELTADDRPLITALGQHNIEAIPARWDDTVDWSQFDRLVLRSCRDYQLRIEEFLRWLGELEQLGVALETSASLVRWNHDKRYLRQLEEHGTRIPATIWIGNGEEANVHDIMAAHGWDSAVAKPTISASAHCLKCVFMSEPVALVNGPAMVQPFLPEILASGEWSLVFIAGEFSHAVLKAPMAGEFRVQTEFGSTAITGKPARRTIEIAKQIVDGLPERPLYARVDGLEDEHGFMLMEVELIEPQLFLGLGGAVQRFARSIAA